MDIEDLKKERRATEEAIRDAVNPILLDFAKKTGVFIEYVFLHSTDEVETIDGHEVIRIGDVTCNVRW